MNTCARESSHLYWLDFVIRQMKNQTLDSCVSELREINYFSSINLVSILVQALPRLEFPLHNVTHIPRESSLKHVGKPRNRWVITNCLPPQSLAGARAEENTSEVPRWQPLPVIIVTCLFIFPLRNWMSKKKRSQPNKSISITGNCWWEIPWCSCKFTSLASPGTKVHELQG